MFIGPTLSGLVRAITAVASSRVQQLCTFGRQCSPAPHSILQLFEYLEDSAPQHPTPSSSSDILFAPLQQSSQVLGGEPSLLSKSVIRGTRCVNLTGGWRKKKLFGKVDQSGFPSLFSKAPEFPLFLYSRTPLLPCEKTSRQV